MHGAQVEPSVSAVVHYVRSLWYKHQKDFAEFYKSSLLYLAFISSDALPAEQKLVRLAVPDATWQRSLPHMQQPPSCRCADLGLKGDTPYFDTHRSAPA